MKTQKAPPKMYVYIKILKIKILKNCKKYYTIFIKQVVKILECNNNTSLIKKLLSLQQKSYIKFSFRLHIYKAQKHDGSIIMYTTKNSNL